MSLHAPSKTKTRVKYLLHRMEQGWSPMCDNVPAESDEWGVMKAGCANGPQFDPTQNKRLPPDVIPATEYEIKVGDVIMSRANTTELLGSAALVKQTPPRLLLCDKLYRLVVDEGKTTPEYLVHWLRSTDARCQMEAEATGASASMQNIGHDTVRNLKLVVPALADQRRIAAYLDAETRQMDALVAEKEAMLKLLEEKRAAQISHAVTRGLNPRAPLKPSALPWLGDIPKHWEVRRCANLFQETDVRDEPELPLLLVSINTGVTLRVFSDDRIESTAEDFNSYKVARQGQLAFNKMRFWQGAAGIAPVDGLVSPDYTVATVGPELDPQWIEHLFRLPLFSSEVRRHSHGIVDDRLRLYWEGFRDIRIPVPPLEEQRAIVAHLAAERERTAGLEAALRESIQLLQERRRALITAAVTGQISHP